MQNPRSDVTALTSFAYDSTGALVKTTNALGQTVQVTQHTPGGLPLTIVDANGVTTQFTYDARQWLTSSAVTTAAGVLTTSYAYDPAGNLLTVNLPDGSAVANAYDAAHRLTGMTDLLNQTIAYTLDADGDRTQTSIANAAGAVQSKHASLYDALGRLTLDTGGANQQTSYFYDSNGNALSTTKPLSHLYTQTFDALNRLTGVRDPLSGTTTTAYDTQDHPQSVLAPNGGKTSYIYDGFGEVIEQSSPDSGNTIYAYDADGNLSQKSDASGAVTNYTYDALDRVTAATYPADTSENVTYTYDQTGHGFGIGRLTAVTDAAGTLSRTYDERGNLLGETRQVGSATLTMSYGYDAAGRIASVTYPSGNVVTYVRDSMGRVTSVTVTEPGTPSGTKHGTHSVTVTKPGASSAQTIVSGIGYEPFGPLNGLTFGNGIRETRTFDADYRMTRLTDSGTRLFQGLFYGYDAADNVLSLYNAATPQKSQSFQYDALNRLTLGLGGNGAFGYSYDSVGNRLTQQIGPVLTSYAYTPQTNRLSTVTSKNVAQAIGYTGAGNINSIGTSPATSMTYNQAGRLAAVTSGTQNVATYFYDAFGQRLSKSTSAGGTLFQYDPQGHMLEETTANGTALVDYVYLDDGRLIATVAPSTGSVSYVLSDRLGTPQIATNSAQAVVWSAVYQPFGQTITTTGSVTQHLRLPGQFADAETGWSQNGFRDYVPALGRYLESDPMSLRGGVNTYGYVADNPMKYTDAHGLLLDFMNRNSNADKIIQAYDGPNSASQSPDAAVNNAIKSYNAGTKQLQFIGQASDSGALSLLDPYLLNPLSYFETSDAIGWMLDTITEKLLEKSPSKKACSQ